MIDISQNMADLTPHFWDGYWSDDMGKSSSDPDCKCLLLQEYHCRLWSKKLPSETSKFLKNSYQSGLVPRCV